MSDFFKDAKYKELDWISQAIEPWDYSLIEVVAQMPDRVEVSPSKLLKLNNDYRYGSLSIDRFLLEIDQRLAKYATADYKRLFKFEMAPDTTLDLRTKELSNPIYIVKIKPTLDDLDIKEIALTRIRDLYWSVKLYINSDYNALTRANEIMDLLGITTRSKSGNKKRRLIIEALHNIMSEDKWRIRSIELIDKMIGWIYDYINNGEIACLVNFTKLKIMTHSGQPIYSIKEEV